jgi:hypothetical protein
MIIVGSAREQGGTVVKTRAENVFVARCFLLAWSSIGYAAPAAASFKLTSPES